MKEGIDPAAFERFAAEELTATFDEHVPGVRAFIMKGDRGNNEGGYLFVLVFDSINTRDFYFSSPEVGEANMPQTPLELWELGQRVILDRLLEFVVSVAGASEGETPRATPIIWLWAERSPGHRSSIRTI